MTWELLDCGTPNEQGIVGYDISWINMADGSEETASVSHTESSYDVPVYTQGYVYGNHCGHLFSKALLGFHYEFNKLNKIAPHDLQSQKIISLHT